MKNFIVMQGRTYDQEFERGIIWSPQQDSSGNTPHSWRRMLEVQKGDRVFHYVKGNIVAISLATSACLEAEKPATMSEHEQWRNDGYLVELNYFELEKPLHIRTNFEDIQPLLPIKYSPLQQNGRGNQGYLYPCNEELALKLLDIIGEQNIPELNGSQSTTGNDTGIDNLTSLIAITETEAKTKIRIGQSQFRHHLLKLWNHKCAICDIDLPQLLRASHAIPWKDSSHEERIDPYNGILLCCNHDELYDKGFITFDQNGSLHISSEIVESDFQKYGLESHIRINIYEKNQKYFQWHQKEIFRK